MTLKLKLHWNKSVVGDQGGTLESRSGSASRDVLHVVETTETTINDRRRKGAPSHETGALPIRALRSKASDILRPIEVNSRFQATEGM